MVCEMENDHIEDMDIEILHSMWPEDIETDVGKKFNIEKPGKDQDMLEEIIIMEESTIVDFKRLMELTNYTDKGSSQLSHLMKHLEYKQANAVRLLREELDNLSKQRREVELRKLEILEEHRFEEGAYGDKRTVSILDDIYDIWQDVPRRKRNVVVQNKIIEINAEYDTTVYWKQRALHLEKMLEESVQREQILAEKLQESIKNLEKQSSPVEELSQILKRADNFLHFVLQNAPVVIGHQDKELRYRFIYNHFPSLHEEDIIGKTDVEIFTGSGVKESQDFKREVLEKGLPAKREITFETELFGSKTFLIYVEPVFSKTGETLGINYMGMDVTDQVRKRERMMKIREEIAVQKAKETELNKTIHITEETMRAKQMLATMSHEIRSPLSGVVSMAEILSRTKLDREQRQLLGVMLSSGDLVLQLINDILDLSKVESGVMKLEATKFRPREVVKHVLQTAAASLRKKLTLEGHVADDVPAEVIGDVLRIRQILTNLVSNAVKFTHEGKVGINLYVVPEPSFSKAEASLQKTSIDQSSICGNEVEDKFLSTPQNSSNQNHASTDEDRSSVKSECLMNGGTEEQPRSTETTVWIRCDVYDTGIGIPEKALPTLFKRYMQVSADHARKYGGTGLGLAICKQLVELMGGRLTVTSKEHSGSTFTFILPYKISTICDHSDEPSDTEDDDDAASDDTTEGVFQFQPATSGTLFSSYGSSRTQTLLPQKIGCATSRKFNGFSENSYSVSSNDVKSKEITSVECVSSITDCPDISECACSSGHGPEIEDENVNIRNKSGNDSAHSSYHTEVDQGRATIATMSREQAHQSQERAEIVSQCVAGSSSEVAKPNLKPKILLVEDNKINVMVTQSMMKQLGHSIDVVNNGVEAVSAVQRQSYDLILMLLLRPKINLFHLIHAMQISHTDMPTTLFAHPNTYFMGMRTIDSTGSLRFLTKELRRDVCMPVMNGLQATKLIRSFEETGNWDAAREVGIELNPPASCLDNNEFCFPAAKSSHIPIIAMTANALSESAEECFENGMDSFVSKPVTFQKLKECIEQYLQ